MIEENKDSLILPSHVRVQLTTPEGEPFHLSGVIMSVHCFARHKNDFDLGPFFTNDNGIAVFTNELLNLFVEAELASGLMDYSHINNCFPFVEIRFWSKTDLDKAVEGRKVWGLVGRESELWNNVDELISLFRTAPNQYLNPNPAQLRDIWDGKKEQYEYSWAIYDRRNQ